MAIVSRLLWLKLPFLLLGCSQSDSNNDAANNFTILEGTVPGTYIEAFCDDGSHHFAHSTSTLDNHHPFSFSIPKHLNCRLVMTTNKTDPAQKIITPIRITTAQAEGIIFYGIANTATLGFVDLSINRSLINDTTNDGINDDILSVYAPSSALAIATLTSDLMDSDGDGIINVYDDDENDDHKEKEDAHDDEGGS